MKQLYTLFFALLLAAVGICSDTDPARGYIVTKNGKQLTGYIGELYHTQSRSIIVFINDFGSAYNIEAERIRGFVYLDEKGYTAFESKNCHNRWYFLRIMEKGPAVNLYRSPEEEYNIQFKNGILTTNSRSINEYWLEIQDRKQPIRIHSLNFRRKMRRLFNRQDAPEYRDKVGKEGYRFRNLPDIIREYNKDKSLNKREI